MVVAKLVGVCSWNPFNILNGPTPASYCFFSFKTQILQKNFRLQRGIRTRMVKVEREHADHLTTTVAYHSIWFTFKFIEKTKIKKKGRQLPNFFFTHSWDRTISGGFSACVYEAPYKADLFMSTPYDVHHGVLKKDLAFQLMNV